MNRNNIYVCDNQGGVQGHTILWLSTRLVSSARSCGIVEAHLTNTCQVPQPRSAALPITGRNVVTIYSQSQARLSISTQKEFEGFL